MVALIRKKATVALAAIFIALGVVWGIRALALGNIFKGVLGLCAPLVLLLPVLFKRWLGGHPWLLYSMLLGFLILAYDVGSVREAFDNVPHLDKVSHFLSGFVFTIAGFCLYAALQKKPAGGGTVRPPAAISYAFFFSTTVAVVWEIIEYTGFVLFGMDSQHTLTTGVVDTMQDLLACFVASLVCAAFLALYLRRDIKLLAGRVADEWMRLCGVAPRL